jgi:hypothetical protein
MKGLSTAFLAAHKMKSRWPVYLVFAGQLAQAPLASFVAFAADAEESLPSDLHGGALL